MSSIVSRRPPPVGSVSHSNERRWISIRLGTSRGLFRRAKLRRVRSTEAAGKLRLLRGRERTDESAGAQTTKDSTAKLCPREGGRHSRTPPLERSYVARADLPGRLRLSVRPRHCSAIWDLRAPKSAIRRPRRAVRGAVGVPRFERGAGAARPLSAARRSRRLPRAPA